MLRRLVLACCLAGTTTACKVVHSTAGDDGGTDTDRPSIGFAADSTRVAEGPSSIAVIVSLSQPASHPVTVTFETIDSDAILGVDYDIPFFSFTIPAGDAVQSIPITIIADGLDEAEESFELRLVSAQGATLDTTGFARTRHTVSIVANQAANASFQTSSSGADEAVNHPGIYIVLSSVTNSPVTVNYTVVGGSATPDDYLAFSGQAHILPGYDRDYFPVYKVDDIRDEPDETIVLSITSVQNALVGPVSIHTHTIRDDDPPPQLSFAQAMQNAGEGDTGESMITIQLALSAPSGFPITVPFTVDATSTAVNPADYRVVTTSPITIPTNTLSTSITIAVAGDTAVEGNETIKLQLGTPTNATLGAPTLHTVNIVDDD